VDKNTPGISIGKKEDKLGTLLSPSISRSLQRDRGLLIF
jgi:hypothetical protein